MCGNEMEGASDGRTAVIHIPEREVQLFMNSELLVLYDELGTRQELTVNFSDGLKGKKMDFLIQS